MSQISPSKVLAEVAAAVPATCRGNIVVIGSLAAGYHFFKNDPSKAVRTKDVDCVLAPFHAAVGAGQDITRQLLDEGWQQRMAGDHQQPGNAATPVDQLPAVRLYPPGVDPDSEQAWFIELLTVPESTATEGRKWTRLPLEEGHFGLPTFRFISITAFDAIPAGDLGIRYARPEMMALANLLEHTDVLQIRVETDLPRPRDVPQSATPEEAEKAREGVARSIAESVRLAAYKLLDLPEMELASSYRWKANGIEIILYDAVSGGAGYCKKVHELHLSKLLMFAKNEIATCSGNCTRSCSKCLRSYSNQTYWEEFRRIDALDWLSRVCSLRRDDPRVMSGAVDIQAKRVEEICTNASQVILLRKSLGDLVGGLPTDDATGTECAPTEVYPGWKAIQEWLATGKQVHIVSASSLDFHDPTNGRAFRIAAAFLPHVQDQKLELSVGVNSFTGTEPHAIAVNETEQKATLLYSPDFIGSSLERLWPETVLSKEIALTEMSDFFSPGALVSVAELQPPSGVRHSHYRMNQPRDLAKDFQFIATEEIKSIEIVDRYLFAMDHNTHALESLLVTFAAMWKSKPERITLTYGPAGNPMDDHDWRNSAFNLVVALQKNPDFSGISILPTPRSYREPKGDKHDRRIRIQSKPVYAPAIPNATGRRQRSGQNKQPKQVSQTFIAELTGGVSHLMDAGSETNVFTWVK